MFVAVYNSSVWPNKFHCNVFFNFSSYQDQGQGLRYQPVRGQGSQFRGQFRGQGRASRRGQGIRGGSQGNRGGLGNRGGQGNRGGPGQGSRGGQGNRGGQGRGSRGGQGRGIRGGRGRGSQTSSPSDSSRSSSPSSYSNLQQVQEAVARFRFLNKRYPKKWCLFMRDLKWCFQRIKFFKRLMGTIHSCYLILWGI